ncbi:MAG: cation diffusion facilitator family transporter [Eubacteriales bacterium]|nr:cation diffusion facilitator family transporter [Eubacteriales bacterium]
MTELLSKIFVKNSQNTSDPKVRQSYGTMTSIVCIVINILLASGKFMAGFFSGSVAIQADAVNNFSDAGSSIISLVSCKISNKPADKDHPFGHARIEYVASMIVSFIILMIGVELFRDSITKIIHPVTTDFSIFSVVILSVSILCKLWMYLFNRKIGKKINSDVMLATAADSLSDVVSTGAVLITTLMLRFTGFDADAYVGIAVSVFIFITGAKILNKTKNSILGEAPVSEVVDAIKNIVAEYPDALGIHDMMVHNYGPGHTIASLHVEVDGSRDIFETHDTIDTIENRIRNELGIICTIHLDPIVTNDEERDKLLSDIQGIAKSVEPDITIHDFRYVKGPTRSNLIFDIVLPFDSKLTPSEACEKISDSIKQENPTYNAIITVDRG